MRPDRGEFGVQLCDQLTDGTIEIVVIRPPILSLCDDTALDEFVDVPTNTLTAHARKLREFDLVEFFSRVDLHHFL